MIFNFHVFALPTYCLDFFFSFFSLKLRDSLVSPCWASHLFCTMDDLELNLPPSQPGCWDHYSCTLLTSCGLDIDFGALCNTLATDFVIFCFFFFVPVCFNFERHCSQPQAAQSDLELVTFLAFVSQELGRQGCATIFTCLV